ncbi:MAG: hypothetical protein WA602_03795, partial [Silvibacterium sp.]
NTNYNKPANQNYNKPANQNYNKPANQNYNKPANTSQSHQQKQQAPRPSGNSKPPSGKKNGGGR